MTARHQGEVVVIAGAGGIGQALAVIYARDGASVALLDVDQGTLQSAEEALSKFGTSMRGFRCDLTAPDECAAAISAVEKEFGRIDVLAHCAGLTQISPFAQTDIEVIRRVMEINLFGPMYLTKLALPVLKQSKGRIIALSSLAGIGPLVGRSGYCASKYALHGFLETLRAELVDAGVSVTIACPSYVDTNFTRKGLRGDGEVLNRGRRTQDKLLTPDTVAEAVYRGADRRKPLVLVTNADRFAVFVARLFPGLYMRLMRRRYGVELEDADRR